MMLKETVEWCKPTRATKYSAGIDLYAKNDVVIGAGETKIVNLGVKIDKNNIEKIINNEYSLHDDIDNYKIDLENHLKFIKLEINNFMKSHFLELHPRSSLRAKGLVVGVGVIDLDYPDELGLIVHNPLNSIIIDAESNIVHIGVNKLENICEYTINKGYKIAQVLLKEHKGFLFGIESDAERSGGYGSSGN